MASRRTKKAVSEESGNSATRSGSVRQSGAWRHFSDEPVPPILHAALKCFVEHGYHGTTMRMISASAGLSVPGLYHHYESKQAMIIELMDRAMTDIYERSLAALEDAGDDVVERLRLHVECLVLFHAHRSDLAFLAANEIRGLNAEARTRHIASRDQQQDILDRIVDNGIEQGVFRVEFPHDTSRAIVTMCTSVAQWYKLGGGPLSPQDVAERYVVLALRALDYDPGRGSG